MITFKNLVRVRCLECNEENFIEMKSLGIEKQQRSMGFEYEHIFRGELTCANCKEYLELSTTIYEYPKEFINYIDNSERSCIRMNITNEDSINVS